jgi:hypothetical protein
MEVGELRDLIRSYNPAVVFPSETKKKAKAMDKLQWSLGFKNGVAVDCLGKSEGLALWWRDDVEVLGDIWGTTNRTEAPHMGSYDVFERPR